MKKYLKKLFEKLGYTITKISDQENNNITDLIDIQGLDKIQYGCADNYLKDWLNVDRNVTGSIDFHTAKVNLTKRHPFPNAVFSYGFAEDFIACLEQSELIVFLYEVFRTFKKGGVLRLSSPGLEGVLHKHYKDLASQTAILAKQEAFDMWSNIHFCSFAELELICKHIGFNEINRVEFGKSAFPVLTGLDTRINQIGLNAYIEIVK